MEASAIEYHNGIAILKLDSHISKWVKESGRLDHDQNVLPRILPFIPVDGIVIDAGAFIGDHTIAYVEKVGKDGGVIAFEPFTEAFECLKYNLSKYENVSLHNRALSNECKQVSMSIAGLNYGMATVSEGKGIMTVNLDSLKEPHLLNKPENRKPLDLPRFDFFKIDVEGMEIDVLLGAKQTIEKFKPVMFIEVNEHTLKAKGYTKNDLLQTIHDLGYTYRNVYEEQGLDDEQFDVLCFPK